MGLKTVPARSTLSEALNQRDWRIYGPRPPRHELAARLIVRARALYAHDPLSIELDATGYALDAATIDLCWSLFDGAPCGWPWAIRSTKAAVKLHTLLDLRGAIPPSFTSAMASCTRSTCWIFCRSKQAPSMSWIAAMALGHPVGHRVWISLDCTHCIRRARSL